MSFFILGEVKSVRLMTDRVTGKPKGFAFVEFTTSASLGVSYELCMRTVSLFFCLGTCL